MRRSTRIKKDDLSVTEQMGENVRKKKATDTSCMRKKRVLPVGRSAKDAADGEYIGEKERVSGWPDCASGCGRRGICLRENGAATVKGERNGSAAAEDKNGNI